MSPREPAGVPRNTKGSPNRPPAKQTQAPAPSVAALEPLVRAPVPSPLPEETRALLTTLDDQLVVALERGDIRLVRAAWLLALPEHTRLVRRQELKAIEGIEPLLTPDEAVDAVRKGNRSVGALSHGWMSPVRASPPPPLSTSPPDPLPPAASPHHRRAAGCARRAIPIPTVTGCAPCGAR